MDNLFSLKGKTALVIGYTGNLGPVWIKALNDAGADTYAIGLPSPKEDNADNASFNTCDVTKPKDFWKFDHITPDVLVYNAGVDNPPDADAVDGYNPFRNYKEITEVNQTGAINALEFFIPKMIKSGGGSIHLIGSIMGYGPCDESNYPTTPNGQVWTKPIAYNTSKRAYLQIAQSVTRKYGKDGIRCTVPAFGPVDMGQLPPDFMDKFGSKVPTGRATTIDDLKRTLLFHACCENFAGQDTLVDGGYRER
jgi:NAD(P)-dependent dehydrogenase (short-subunit alcohol dehydrogenase family)